MASRRRNPFSQDDDPETDETESTETTKTPAKEKPTPEVDVIPGLEAPPAPPPEEAAPEQPPQAKTKYQIGRDAYLEENPDGDFDSLSEEEQNEWIEKGLETYSLVE